MSMQTPSVDASWTHMSGPFQRLLSFHSSKEWGFPAVSLFTTRESATAPIFCSSGDAPRIYRECLPVSVNKDPLLCLSPLPSCCQGLGKNESQWYESHMVHSLLTPTDTVSIATQTVQGCLHSLVLAQDLLSQSLKMYPHVASLHPTACRLSL